MTSAGLPPAVGGRISSPSLTVCHIRRATPELHGGLSWQMLSKIDRGRFGRVVARLSTYTGRKGHSRMRAVMGVKKI